MFHVPQSIGELLALAGAFESGRAALRSGALVHGPAWENTPSAARGLLRAGQDRERAPWVLANRDRSPHTEMSLAALAMYVAYLAVAWAHYSFVTYDGRHG